MTTDFIAVVRTGTTDGRAALLAAGATAVLGWAELATSDAADDTLVVLLEPPDASDTGRTGLAAALAGVLGPLGSVDPSGPVTGQVTGPVAGPVAGRAVRADPDVVIATVRPVVDTLKLVAVDNVLTGTAERDDHRFVGTPIATRLRVLRAVCRELTAAGPADRAGTGPSAVAVLAALVDRGAMVLGGTPAPG